MPRRQAAKRHGFKKKASPSSANARASLLDMQRRTDQKLEDYESRVRRIKDGRYSEY